MNDTAEKKQSKPDVEQPAATPGGAASKLSDNAFREK